MEKFLVKGRNQIRGAMEEREHFIFRIQYIFQAGLVVGVILNLVDFQSTYCVFYAD